MADSISIALTGLAAQRQRLAVSVSNIANYTTTGSIPTENSPVSTVYKPLQITQMSIALSNGEGAGVQTTVSEATDAYTTMYDPSSIYANSEGFVAAPNVSLEKELATITEIKTQFKANMAIIKAEKEMIGELMDIIS